MKKLALINILSLLGIVLYSQSYSTPFKIEKDTIIELEVSKYKYDSQNLDMKSLEQRTSIFAEFSIGKNIRRLIWKVGETNAYLNNEMIVLDSTMYEFINMFKDFHLEFELSKDGKLNSLNNYDDLKIALLDKIKMIQNIGKDISGDELFQLNEMFSKLISSDDALLGMFFPEAKIYFEMFDKTYKIDENIETTFDSRFSIFNKSGISMKKTSKVVLAKENFFTIINHTEPVDVEIDELIIDMQNNIENLGGKEFENSDENDIELTLFFDEQYEYSINDGLFEYIEINKFLDVGEGMTYQDWIIKLKE